MSTVHGNIVVMCWNYTVVERARSKCILESSESKLNSDSSDEKEKKLGRFSPKNKFGTTSFVFHFLEKIQRADWGATVFGSWVDIISNRCPRLRKRGHTTIQAWLWKGIESRGFKQIQKFFHPNASNNKWIRFSAKNIWGVRWTNI